MKKLLLLLAFLGASLSQMLAADSEWMFYVYESSTGSDLGTFQTTSNPNVFKLRNVSIPNSGSGFSFMIRKSDWTGYGWGTETVAQTGVAYSVAAATTASGWSTLAVGVYDITFNLSNLTIRFDTHSDKKKVSILGDSYSTMEGCLTPSTNAYWYTNGSNPWHETDVTAPEQTWWYQFINGGDYVLEYNNSYSGSTMVNTPLEGMDVSTTFISRATDLGSPEIIFVFGGTNDTWNTALTMGGYKFSDWTEEDKKQFRPGFAYLLYLIKQTYPDTEVYFILNDILSEEINQSIATICNHYSIPCIATKNVGKSDYHPNAEGMTTIATQVKAVVESSNDESDTWFISGDFNSWATTQTFTQSDENPNEFTLKNFSITSDKMDSYNGFSFQISNSGWAKTYTYAATVSTTGVYSLDDKTAEGAWNSIYCTAMTAGTKYHLTWNRLTHVLQIEAAASAYDDAISYTTYPDGHAVATVNDYLRGGDISMLNYVESLGAKFYDANGTEKDPLDIMQENGVNIVRLRLYNNPGEEVTYNSTSYKLPAGYCNETDVLNLARRAKQHNMKIELTFHYSDFWTNGECQFKPSGWEGYNMNQLKQAVYDYTYNFLQKMNAQGTTPEYVSLGNEIQGGILFGHYSNVNNVSGYATNGNMANLAGLLNQGSAAVRAACPQAKVIIHLTLSTGVTESTYQWFFDAMKDNSLDYDVIGTSYYPYWTNEKPTMLTSLANNMYTRYGKDILIMETGYSWTQYLPNGRTGGNYEGQLHMNGTPYNEATETGQKAFMKEVQTVVKDNDHILGYLYWDPVMVDQQVNSQWIETTWALRKSGGNWYQDGNVVSNTTWFDYEGKALPVFEAISEDMHIVPATVTIGGNTYTMEHELPFELTVGETEYATFYDGVARTLPDGLTAYTVQSVVDSKLSMQESELSVIPADCGVLLQGNEGTYYLWPRYNDNSTITGNMLYGTTTEQTINTPTGSYYYYKLVKDATNGLGWYWGEANGGVFTNGAHKAYLAVPQTAGARSFIGFGDGTTAVETLNRDPLTVNQKVYDLQGRRVVNPTKGLYIVGGKKVVIK